MAEIAGKRRKTSEENMGRVDGKVALVTGGAKGLGLASARALVTEGARVMITDVDGASGEAAARELGSNAVFRHQDVTDKKSWEAALDDVVARFGTLNILVNSAGVGSFFSVEEISDAEWHRTINVNLNSIYLGTKAAIERMKGRNGSIINIASVEGMVGDALLPAYNASKGAVRMFTRSSAIHCARSGYGIRINALCPGFAETQMVSDALAALDPAVAGEFAAKTLARVPMGRFAAPAEIAACVLFLASDESSYVTGSDLVVDGGLVA
jgi:NAD(P)-dependent dehydrogenase (short-subunit alcohol dehydrogenase family)